MDNNTGDTGERRDNFVSTDEVKKYVSRGVPIVPLGKDGHPLVNDLYTSEEYETILSNLSEFELKNVFRDPVERIGIKPINLLLRQDPLKFWADEKIRRQKWYGIASIAGPSTIPSEIDPNKVKLFIQIDADDPKPKAIVRKVIEKRGHLTDRKTIVQDTPGGGLHCVFAVPVDPNNLDELDLWKKRFLRPSYCKPDCRIEIKTWFGGQITLEPSPYRKDRTKAYHNISGYWSILEEDPIVYDLLISDLKNADCLRFTPEEAHKLDEESAEEDTKCSNGAADCPEKDRELNDPSDTRVRKVIDIILGKDVDKNGECHFNSIYVKGQRNETIIPIIGHLFHNRIRLEFAKEIVRRLCQDASDEEIEQRINTADETYKKGYNKRKILGRSGLIDAFKRADKNGENEVRAKARLAALNEAFGFDKNNNSKNPTDSKFSRINEADLIAELARKKIRFMFINEVKQPCAIIERDDLVELMVMSDKDGNFADSLRQIWRDENEVNGNKRKTTLPEERLNQARLSLISDAKRMRIEPIKTHLRVAWEKKNEVMRYDLADPQRRQVRIWGTDDGSGVETIDSNHVLDEIKEFESSRFSKEKTPIFFQRFNQTAQVIPSKNFDPSILDVFINDLTNVVGRKASSAYRRSVQHWETEGSLDDDTKIHIAKVGLISMLVPDIPHHLENVFGPPQAIKSTFLRQKKALIDPTTLDLFLPTKLKDIDKILNQNYFICFDNFYQVSREFSDLICAAITGSGTQVRELFTTQTMVTLPIKACIAFSSVTRLFTQSDAVSRLLSYEFLPFAEEEGYRTEDEINDRFEQIQPQILACMYHTMSKAINIRNRIHGKYRLGRMADVLEWGEAISQALGYEPGLYLERYQILKKIQSRHSASYDPLIYYLRKIYFDLFLKLESEYLNGRLNSTEEAVREKGYIVFTYKELNEKLNEYAKEDEYDTKKSNKLWPQDSQQLANRIREVSIVISKNDGFAIEVRRGKDNNSNEYVLGNKEEVERYIESQEVGPRKSQAENNTQIDNSSVGINERSVVQSGVQLNTLNTSGAHPTFPLATFEVVDRSIVDHKSWKSKIGAPSGGVQLNTFEHLERPVASEIECQLPEIRHKCSKIERQIEHRRSKVFELNAAGYSQRKIAKKLNISLGLVNLDLKHVQNPNQNQSVQSVQIEHPFERIEHPFERSKYGQEFYEKVLEFENFAAIDCEWYREDISRNRESGLAGKIYCFCLVDNKGHEIRLHLKNFGNDQSRFMSAVLDAIDPYDALIGYGILSEKKNEFDKGHIDGDIRQITKNCDKLEPVIKDRIDATKKRIKLLDLHNIFSCPNVKAFLEVAENVKYRNNTLQDVSSAYLKKGKMNAFRGSDAEFLEPEMQLEYCLHDARLCLELAEKDDYRLLKIMHNISNEIGQDFYSTCNYTRPTAWWANKLRPLNYQKIEGEDARWQENHITRDNKGKKKGVPYTGGKVLDPVPGIHKDVVTYDVGSMYPTMGNVYNISSETINCDCCKGDPTAKIPDTVMELINNDLVASGHEPRPWHYWICRKRRGIFSYIMKDLYQKKCEYEKQGLVLEEKAVKLFANSGYGTFGQVYFEYYDFRVAELITGFGRHTLLGLRELLNENGIEILYGDTDSLFVKNSGASINENLNIEELAREKFYVDFSKERIWKLLVLGKNKKQYFGILDNGEHMCKTLIGLKGDKPPYFSEVVSRLIDKETLELFLNTDAKTGDDDNAKQHVLNHIQSSFGILSDKLLVHDMDFIKEKLVFTMQTKDPLYKSTDNRWQKYIFDEILQDCNGDRLLAERRSHAKSTHTYWKILPNGRPGKKSCTLHPERHTLDARGYKDELWTCIQPIIEAYGFPDNECTRLKDELVDNHAEP